MNQPALFVIDGKRCVASGPAHPSTTWSDLTLQESWIDYHAPPRPLPRPKPPRTFRLDVLLFMALLLLMLVFLGFTGGLAW